MPDSKTAIIIGVGAVDGVGARVARRAAAAGYQVFVGGRTQDRLDVVVAAIESDGGSATAAATDTTDEAAVTAFVAAAEAAGPIGFAVNNTGNNMPGDFLEMDADYFEAAWRVGCFGGFLFARDVLRQMVPRGEGTLIFTGASASLRGRPNFAAFTSAKAGLRAMAQSLARAYQPAGIHVAHVVIDGGINGEKLRTRRPEAVERMGEDGLVGLDGIADAYMFLHDQPRNAWTHELDLRTHKESF